MVDTSAASSTTRLPSAHSARWSRAAAVSSAASSISLRPAAGEPPAASRAVQEPGSPDSIRAGDGAPEGFEVGEALRPGGIAGGGEAGAGVGVADGYGGGCFYKQSVAVAVYGQASQGEVLPLVSPLRHRPPVRV